MEKGNVKYLVIGGILIAIGGSYLIFRKKINAWIEKKFSGKKDEGGKDEPTTDDVKIDNNTYTTPPSTYDINFEISKINGLNENLIKGKANAFKKSWLQALKNNPDFKDNNQFLYSGNLYYLKTGEAVGTLFNQF